MVFNREGRVVSVDQKEHEQIFPKAGWVEHNAVEIWENTRAVSAAALGKVDLTEKDIAAVGITNQRETALVWDRTTGKPVYNAIVWQDTRTDGICHQLADLGGGVERYKAKVGLPLATYFSGPKVRWILDNVEGARAKAEAGDLVFGNMDTWTLWNMTGGVDGGLHVTDPTNASRTLLNTSLSAIFHARPPGILPARVPARCLSPVATAHFRMRALTGDAPDLASTPCLIFS